ncbi:Prephenate dehydrogenase [Lentibacillus sp. JNUCC-1]|uniref:prephenate dehydrogenase n=1 Tax=Lentibacillus sp. JNUCC-1 TaxID=2654513 RepID=UPI0012E83D8E|nr:prephenate dehydrogenase [Lentibacillus sp. JNUCC-1]MUV37847.1 Prephenate dehydrogenase [Lentibacillus sp. JNUCC-1]
MKGNVLIAGLGLIGGSLALAIKSAHPDAKIYGYDVNQSEMDKASARRIIDHQAASFRYGAERADLIILATPVLNMEPLIRQLPSLNLRKNAIITDTGSTKGGVMKFAEMIRESGLTFIGGHPMAGSHKTGVESAKAHLFENAYYVLTPCDDTPTDKIADLKHWLSGTRSHFLVLDTEEHDAITGVISHFPHVIAAGLVNLTQKHATENPLISMLAAGGFRDITRIASSSPVMWKDIVKQNRGNLLELLDNWMAEMRHIQMVLTEDDEAEILQFFEAAKTYRDSLPVHSKGALQPYYDLDVDVIDVPGAIARITALLAEEGISVTNLHIMEAREGLLGVLRVSFQNESDRERARVLLEQSAYQTYASA